MPNTENNAKGSAGAAPGCVGVLVLLVVLYLLPPIVLSLVTELDTVAPEEEQDVVFYRAIRFRSWELAAVRLTAVPGEAGEPPDAELRTNSMLWARARGSFEPVTGEDAASVQVNWKLSLTPVWSRAGASRKVSLATPGRMQQGN
jgi:hypothetical protein